MKQTSLVQRLTWHTAVAVLFLLVSCSQSQAGPVTSVEGMVGTWTRSINGTERQFAADGTLHRTGDMDINGTFWFEGETFFIQDDSPVCADSVGTYQVEALSNGSLQFTAIDDQCLSRVSDLAGSGTAIEWVPVP